MIVNFMYPFERAMGYRDIWWNIILGMPWKGFWMRLTFEPAEQVEQTAVPNLGGPRPINCRPEKNKKSK